MVSGFDLSLLFDFPLLHMVYCEAVRSAILATAWLLVHTLRYWRQTNIGTSLKKAATH